MIELGDGEAAAERLDAIMVWPGDRDRREGYLTALHAARLAVLEPGTEDQIDAALRELLRWAYRGRSDALRADGGWAALARGHPGLECLRAERDERQRQGFVAAEILLYTLTPPVRVHRAGERRRSAASVREAVYLLGAALGEQGRRGGSRERLMAAWSEMRPVAHLWAAVHHLHAYEAGSVALGVLLATAEELRRRGEEREVLNPATTWRMPEDATLPPVEIQLPPLPPRLRVALRSYRPTR